MTSVNSSLRTQITLEFGSGPQPRWRRGRRAGCHPQRRACCRRAPNRRCSPKVNPADQPILYLVVTSTTLRRGRWTNNAERASHSGSAGDERCARCRCSGPEVRDARAVDPHGVGGFVRSASTRSKRRCELERECADRLDHGPPRCSRMRASYDASTVIDTSTADRAPRRSSDDRRRRRGPTDGVRGTTRPASSRAPIT